MSRPLQTYQHAVLEANFPIGTDPWNGQPIKVVPGLDYFTPGTSPAAEEENYRLNAITTDLGNLLQYVGQISAQNWPITSRMVNPADTVGNCTISTLSIAPDPYAHRWLLQVVDTQGSTFNAVYSSTDAGMSWQKFGTNRTNFVTSICVHPTNGLVLATTSAGPGPSQFTNTCYTATTGGTWSTSGAVAPRGNAHSSLWFNNKFVVIGSSQDNSLNNELYNASSTTDGVTWTDHTGTLPAGWLSGTAVLHPTRMAASPTRLICFTQAPSRTTYTSTDDGSAYTDRTIPLLTNEVVYGAAFSIPDNRFMVAVSTGTDSRILTSPDGVNWTVAKVLTGYNLGGLASLGSCFVATIVESSTTSPGRAIMSIDKGVTWRFCAYGQVANTAGQTHRVVSNGEHFLAANHDYLTASLLVGLPGAIP
jgi:hypothetical protein